MKRIITALGNETLNNELKKYSKYDVLTNDIFYQEGVIDFLSTNEADVIIVSSLLQGEYDIYDFACKLKELCFTARIIIIADSIMEEEKNGLISKGIFDILYDESAGVEDVIEAIDREEPINLKAQYQSEVRRLKQEYENSVLENNQELKQAIEPIIQKQEIISIFGTNGSGKSSCVAGLVKAFSKKTTSKILLIDFDTISGNLDELLHVSKIPTNIELIIDEDKKCGLNYAADLSIKNRFDTNVLDEIVIRCNGFDFLSGNTSLHYCQNVLNTDFYDYLLNVWNIYKNKFNLVLNRLSSEIDADIFSEVSKLNLIGVIKQNCEKSDESYEKILETLNYVPKKNIVSKIVKNTKLIASLISNVKA